MEGPLARYHAVLKGVAGSAGITAADLARVTGLPRSTAHR
ncbi:helix-turn-helix domain-containing protein, partial [Pseudomonas syringae group genomosp. 7]